jgi:hypothetical protein
MLLFGEGLVNLKSKQLANPLWLTLTTCSRYAYLSPGPSAPLPPIPLPPSPLPSWPRWPNRHVYLAKVVYTPIYIGWYV